ncbi:Glutamyl-tRNA(Gln) amidotransferase subunit C [Sinobacterium norvegicum]|uniref:Aspartyl/glutamyl-tRNA(Asn/Gln) amidotransferase subunit C n=1 Tax=Sinobacterium norvegicum TaxID=1641715 RepID=A0ABM9ADJ9_9GAMM|nr:Asp-tRNA(Asn)/Glu-tRNA(Gln) amidotransferase subunit GatC [Sinobacterium norvegicum]CAH0991070.1 Glutamyl-tRNA(Gln) amidotransferase subunit C [Sinobacterium norvegicum]
MAIDLQEIEQVARLSRIKLDGAMADEVTQKVGSILQMIDQMQSVDTSDVEPMANPLDAVQRLRADDVTEINQRDKFQSVAPNVEEGLYLVPKVIE